MGLFMRAKEDKFAGGGKAPFFCLEERSQAVTTGKKK